MLHRTIIFRTILFILLLIAYHASLITASAQSATATLSGTITDEQGAVVSGVRITAINTATNFERQTVTNDEGFFTLPLLPPGSYTLNAEQQGFAPVDARNVILNVNDQRALQIQLRAGGVTETVTVEGSGVGLQSQSVEISQLVNERRVRELPLNGENFQRLVLLAPGVGGSGGSTVNNPAINGARASQNTYTIDGIGSNDERTFTGLARNGGAAGFTGGAAAPNLVSTEAIQEFRIVTTNADATFGRSSGGQINIVTKSGTNEFHGSAYEYLRNDAFDARNFFNRGPFFDEQGRAKVPPFRQNLFGGSIGGPLVRDRHFFFGNYEGLRQRLNQTSSATVPNAALINLIPGDLGRFYQAFFIERGIVPASGNPVGDVRPLTAATRNAAIAAGFNPILFDGNLANDEAGAVLISTAPVRDVTQDVFLIRTDHVLTNRLSAAFRYGFAQPEQTTDERALSGAVNQIRQRWQQGIAQFVYSLSPTQIVEVRGGVLRTKSVSGRQGGADETLTRIGVSPEFGAFINPIGTGLSTVSAPVAAGFIDNQTVPQASLLHTLTRGNVTLRSGFDLRYLQINVANTSVARPAYSFNNFIGATGLLGASPTQAQAVAFSASAGVFGTNNGSTTPLRSFRSTQQEYFAQVDWRVSPDVTLNLGLRYTYFGVYREADDAFSNLYAVDSAGRIVPDVSPFAFGRTANTVAPISDDRPLYQPDRNNFQPRLGIAWDIAGRGQTIIRAGYGLYHDRIYQLLFSDGVTNIPFAISSDAANVPFRLGAALPIDPDIPSLRVIDPRIRNPYTHRFNVALEQRLGDETSVTVAYVGARGRDLFGGRDANGGGGFPQSARPDNRFSTVDFITNISASDYNSLQVFGRRRFAQGLDFTVAYTFARSRDNFSTDFTLVPSPFNIGGELVERPIDANFGNSDFDVRHNLTFSHLIDLPFGKGRRFLSNANKVVNALFGGFSLAGIAILRSGEPFSFTLNGERPVLLSGTIDDFYAGEVSSRTQYLIPQTDARPRFGTFDPADPFASVPRNSLRSPSLRTYDVSLIKRVSFTERAALNFEVNAFNVFNRANFAAPNANLGSSFFGQVSAIRAGTNPRQIQLGIKFTF